MNETSTRPDPPTTSHEGYAWVPRVADGGKWRPRTGKQCRWVSNHKGCDGSSVAELKRSEKMGAGNWWAYCEDHLYGRWVEDGQVMQWVCRPIDE